jgi:hypothetical protein
MICVEKKVKSIKRNDLKMGVLNEKRCKITYIQYIECNNTLFNVLLRLIIIFKNSRFIIIT